MAGWLLYLFLTAAALHLLLAVVRWLDLWIIPKFLRLHGVPEKKIIGWVMKEASSWRVVELVRALRGKEPRDPPASE